MSDIYDEVIYVIYVNLMSKTYTIYIYIYVASTHVHRVLMSDICDEYLCYICEFNEYDIHYIYIYT